MAERKTASDEPTVSEVRTVGIRDERETERPFGIPAPPEPEVAVQSDGSGDAPDEASGITVGTVYRVHSGSARVEHADGHSSYHAPGTLLRFSKAPKAFEGQLTEEVSADAAADLESHGLSGVSLPGRPKGDDVAIVEHFTLTTARTMAALAASAADAEMKAKEAQE